MTQTIGETRSNLAEDLLGDTLFKVIEKVGKDKPNMKQYYILITAQPDKFLTNVLRQGVKVTNVKPPKLINSMCFYVDMKRGSLSCMWILPRDYAGSFDALMGEEDSVAIYNSIKGMEKTLA